jgi:hypothetical protein
MTDTITTVGVQLSTYEAWTLMRLMRLSGIPGLPFPPQDALTEEGMKVAEPLALASLRARGLVQFRSNDDTPTVIIDKATGALLGTGALCDYWLTLSVELADTGQVTYIYFSPHLSVIHTQPQPDLHLLSAASSGDILFSAIYSGLALDNINSSTNALSWVLDHQFLAKMAEQSTEDAAQQMADMGMESTDAWRLAAAMHGVKRRASQQVMQTQEVRGIQILADELDYFLCTPQDNGIRIETVNTSQVIEAVMQLIR